MAKIMPRLSIDRRMSALFKQIGLSCAATTAGAAHRGLIGAQFASQSVPQICLRGEECPTRLLARLLRPVRAQLKALRV